jgi:hypothetical protein
MPSQKSEAPEESVKFHLTSLDCIDFEDKTQRAAALKQRKHAPRAFSGPFLAVPVPRCEPANRECPAQPDRSKG